MTSQLKVLKQQSISLPVDLNPDIRGEDLFFRILMVFHKPADWPAWVVAATLCLCSVVILALWELAASGGTAYLVGLGLLAFSLGDWGLLVWLPRAGRSFGPATPQLFMMIIPRLLVAIAAAALAHFGQPAWGAAAFFTLEFAGSVCYLWGLAIEPHRISMSEITVTSPHLPAGAKPIRLLHLSDFHVERLTRREETMLHLVQAAQPDLIVITGDYLNASYKSDPTAIKQVRRLLARLTAPYGVYAVLGTPSVDLASVAPYHFAGTNIRLLRREAIEVDLGEGRRLAILGLDCTHDLDYDGQLLGQLGQVAPGDMTRIFLYHSPELMPVAPDHDLDLYLCGHTHGGQVRLPGFGAVFTSAATGKRYEMGRYDEGRTTLYVSRGIGLEGYSTPRLRLFCPPEMTLVTLTGD
jgi:predicted MPP superfamily phosphohydrolase